jgi:hypothetical protein
MHDVPKLTLSPRQCGARVLSPPSSQTTIRHSLPPHADRIRHLYPSSMVVNDTPLSFTHVPHSQGRDSGEGIDRITTRSPIRILTNWLSIIQTTAMRRFPTTNHCFVHNTHHNHNRFLWSTFFSSLRLINNIIY